MGLHLMCLGFVSPEEGADHCTLCQASTFPHPKRDRCRHTLGLFEYGFTELNSNRSRIPVKYTVCEAQAVKKTGCYGVTGSLREF